MVFQCDRCKSTFAKAQGLARHAARKTPCGVLASNGAENQCQRCGRTYATLGNLNKHIRTSCKVVEPTITVEEKLARMQAHIESLERTFAIHRDFIFTENEELKGTNPIPNFKEIEIGN